MKIIRRNGGCFTLEDYWTLSIYSKALTGKEIVDDDDDDDDDYEDNNNEDAFKEVKVDLKKTAFPDGYLESEFFKSEKPLKIYKVGVTLDQIRSAWLHFLRKMFGACYPDAHDKNILPDVVTDPDLIADVYDAATIHFAELVADIFFCGTLFLKNPLLTNNKRLVLPEGCDSKDLPERIKFPSLYGKLYILLIMLQIISLHTFIDIIHTIARYHTGKVKRARYVLTDYNTKLNDKRKKK